jgi:hypothetical protein
MQSGGPDLILQTNPVIGHMLGAKPDGIGAGESGNFHDAGIGQVAFEDRRELAFAEEFQHTAGAEFHGVVFG